MRLMVQVNSQLRGRDVHISGLPSRTVAPTQLILGARSCAVRVVKRINKGVPTLIVSPAVAKAFHLASETHLHMIERGKTWRLGPVVGFYTDRLPSAERPFGEQTRMFEELTTYGQALGGFVVVMGPGDGTAKSAVRYDLPRRAWIPIRQIVPDIVIRRSGTFSGANGEKARRDLQELQTSNRLHTLPRQSGNKWTLYEVLKQTKELQKHLPKSTLCTSGKQLYQAVMARKDVYIKPPGGAQGVSIYHMQRVGNTLYATWEKRVVPRKTERYTNVFQPETKLQERIIKSEATCIRFWQSIGLQRAIVQDTVILPRVDGCRYDFRWLVQASDEPAVVARVSRVGQFGGVTTNIHTGGTAKPAEEMVEKVVGHNHRDTYIEKMDDIATRVVRTLAARYGAFAELGIDLALTADGEIYIFEINPTPGRRMLRMLSPGTRRLSLEALLEYAIRATGYRG